MSSEPPSDDEPTTSWVARESRALRELWSRRHRPFRHPIMAAKCRERLAADLPVVRVLAAITLGYRTAAALSAVTDDDARSRACERGLVKYDPVSSTFEKTRKGISYGFLWGDTISTRRSDEAFEELWRQTHDGLEPQD